MPPLFLTRIAEETSVPDNAALASALLTVIPLGWGHEVDEHGVVHSWGGRVDPDGRVLYYARSFRHVRATGGSSAHRRWQNAPRYDERARAEARCLSRRVAASSSA